MAGLRLRPAVLAARERLARGREKLRLQHERGSPGIQVCACLTDLLDTVLLDLYQAALVDCEDPELESQIALVPHGGYGRRDVAPYSDVDLMLLFRPGHEERVAPLARQLSQHVCDAGLALGFSLRNPSEACSLAIKDATIFTSLAESRYLGGSVNLYTQFMKRFRRSARRRAKSLVASIEAARRTERRQYGETVYLLKPNVKRSRGGLRDVQMVRWIGFGRCGECDLANMKRMGILASEDWQVLQQAYEFLLRLRNELHFFAGKSQDVLSRSEQVRIAELYEYEGDQGLLPVERFMKDYFHHTSGVRYATAHFVASSRARSLASLFEPLVSHRVDGDLQAGPVHIGATRRGMQRVQGNLSEVLRLMDLANRYNSRIDHRTWQAIRSAMISQENIELTSEARSRFLSLISSPGRLADLLRRLHELRVLERIIPAMAHARCLLQFNEYHKFTVDEHSLRAVECATEFQNRDGPLGKAYVELQNKQLLHLALLLHDLGKGFPEDHSEVGLRIAAETAEHLGLEEQDAETLKFLVHKHLVMAHHALRQDLNDQKTIVDFAVQVGSTDVLQMLYVLTCADLAAVGPGVLNDWKLELITQLYHRTRSHLSEEANSPRLLQTARQRSDAVLQAASADNLPWWERQLANAPPTYLLAQSVPQITDQLRRLSRLQLGDVASWGTYLPERKAVEYTVCTHDSITSGIFHRLTGVLTSQGNSILSAELHTLADDLVVDRFFVHDLDFSGEPPVSRVEEIAAALRTALQQPTEDRPAFRRIWKQSSGPNEAQLNPLPSQVRFDNATSEGHTILNVFTYDRLGLLYTITRTLYDCELIIHVAKIGTYLDQVVDVFYVTDRRGQKVIDREQSHEIRQKLLAAVDDVPAEAS